MVLLGVFPDIEAIASRIMRDASITGGRVYSSIPASPTYPLTVVRRIGGLPTVAEWLDMGRIQVDVYGNNKSEARAAAEAARRALHAAEGTIFPVQAGVVTAVRDDLGLTFLPDPDTGRDRYVFGVAITAHQYVT